MNNTMKYRLHRRKRVRAKVIGTAERPRLSVHISNNFVSCQVIDDKAGKTLASSSSRDLKPKGSMTEHAKAVGDDIAKKAKKATISKVVLDRGHKQYHGRVKALADSARQTGLEF